MYLTRYMAGYLLDKVHGSHEPCKNHGLPRTLQGAWQARRDLNPHHPDLESGALSVRATGLLYLFEVIGWRIASRLKDRSA